jgi:putative phage-type endonuclease
MTASFLEMPAEWGRPEWLEWRRLGCGGSDVAAICGLSTFGSPTSVYYDKVGLAPEQPESESMQWGRLLEKPIAEEFRERTGLYVAAPQCLVIDTEHPWRRATLDGIVVETAPLRGKAEQAEWLQRWLHADTLLGTIEIKTTRDGVYDEIPDRTALQVQWQLGIAELTHCWLAVLHGGQRLEIYEIEFDELVFAQLCTIVDRFWEQHVLAGNPPPADSNPATTAALKAVYGERASDDQVELVTDQLPVAWRKAKARLQAAEAGVEGIENLLRAILGAAAIATYEGEPLVTWKAQRRAGRIDDKRLTADHPEIAAEYRTPDGVTRVLRATKALKALAEVDA